jgi:hypothetical protein
MIGSIQLQLIKLSLSFLPFYPFTLLFQTLVVFCSFVPMTIEGILNGMLKVRTTRLMLTPMGSHPGDCSKVFHQNSDKTDQTGVPNRLYCL